VYARPAEADPPPRVALDTLFRPLPLPPPAQEVDDLNRYLHEMAKMIPVQLLRLPALGWQAEGPVAWTPEIRKTLFTTVSDPSFRGFRRSAAGGFGELVPEPSSGGG
jgi:hypothetical protein